MRILSLLGKIADVITDEINTPESFHKGEDFEKYVEQYLFLSSHYELLEKTHNYKTNSQNFVEASLKPDFKYRDRVTRKEFYVEAKFRTTDYKNKFVWCTDAQLRRYQAINKQTPVFLILGDGGKASWPDNLSLIPLSKAKYTGLFPSYTDKFEIDHEKPVTSKILWSL